MTAGPDPVVVRVTQRFVVAPEVVFAAWLDPRVIGTAMFGPAIRDEEVVRIVLDARVGGAFSFVVRRQGREIDHVGTYLEITPPARLAFTWGVAGSEGSTVRIDIEPAADGGALLTLRHDLSPQWADFAQRTAQGWRSILTSIERSLRG